MGKQSNIKLFCFSIPLFLDTLQFGLTVRKDEQGNWFANPDVQVMDEELVEDIGAAIEMYNGGTE